MPNIRTELVTKRHSYTSEEVPWNIEAPPGSALWRCLKGGLPAAGSSARAAIARRQMRFLRFSVVILVLWLLFAFL